MACTSEARAFFILDSAVTPGSMVWIKKALTRLGSTLAVSLKQPCPIGVAVMHRSKAATTTQLQILLRLGTVYHAREFLACVERLPDADTEVDSCGATDGNMMGSALLALLTHMQKQPARQDCHNHLFILSSSFAGCAHHPKMQRVLQLVCLQRDTSLHFLQLTGPEAELQEAGRDSTQAPQPAAEPQHQDHHHCSTTAATGTGAAAAPDAFLHMVEQLGVQHSVTYTAHVADGEAVTDLMCQAWLRELLSAPHGTSHGSSSAGGSSSELGTTPQAELLLRFGAQTLPCSVQQYILQLDPWLLPAQLCPCHGVPMQPGNGSMVAAAHAEAASSAGDAGSMAALLLEPEAAPWSCCVSGHPVLQPLGSCRSDASVLQLGRHSQLCMAPAAGTADGMEAAHSVAGQAGWSQVPRALPLPEGQPLALEVRRVVQLADIDSMLLFGMPLLLCPSSGNIPSNGTAGAAAQQGGGPAGAPASNDPNQEKQKNQQQQQQVSAGEAGMLMHTLCQLLLEQQQVLLACSHSDLLRRCRLPLLQWFVLQPAGDGSCLLLRRLACREQLLPPRGMEGAAASLIGGCGVGTANVAGAGDDGGQGQGGVVLLDAEQLEAVRGCLQGLVQQPLFGSGAAGGAGAGAGAGGAGAGAAPVPGTGGGQQPRAATGSGCGGVAMEEGAGLGEQPPQQQQQQQQQKEPLLLSCGLEAFVAAIMEASCATYTPPPAAAFPAAPPGPGVPSLRSSASAAPRAAGAAAAAAGPAPAGTDGVPAGASVAGAVPAGGARVSAGGSAMVPRGPAGGTGPPAQQQRDVHAGAGQHADVARAAAPQESAGASAAGDGRPGRAGGAVSGTVWGLLRRGAGS